MNTSIPSFAPSPCRLLALFAFLWTFAPAPAQVAPAPAAVPAEESAGDLIRLSPFTVTAGEETGYRAAGTLSGTRINTSLRDLGSSIQAITPEFLSDTGVTKVTELLQYTTSTEVTGGAGGNFSNASGSTSFFGSDSNIRSPSAITRVRGLADASVARNLYNSPIPFDAYNISQIELNRGANSVLFGLGSPAGILNYNLSEARWQNENTLELRADHHGTFRTVLDLNRVLVADRLAVRLIGLNDETKFKQDPAFRDDRRYYAAASWRPFRSTSLSVSFEKGWIDSTLPRQDPPRDYFTHFFTTGMVTVPNNTDFRDRPTNTAYVSIDSGAIGNLHIFDGPRSSGTGIAFIQYPDMPFGVGVRNPRSVNPARVNDFRHRTEAMQNGREFLINVFRDPLGVNAFALSLVDPSVFDFFNHSIDGRASWQFGRLEALNVALRQEFLNGNAGLELGFDDQSYASGHHDALDGIRGNALMLNISEGQFAYATPGNPASGQALNPNFLRPVVGSRGNFADRISEHRTLRATGFLRHDFTEQSNAFLARLFGRQTLTLLASDYREDFRSFSGISAFMDYDDLRALGYTDLRARANNTGQLGNAFYLGDSVAGRTTASGLGLTGYKGDFAFLDQVQINYIDVPSREIRTGTVRVHNVRNSPPDRIATGAALTRDTLDTMAAVLQSNWWDGTLVSTVGWREDRVKRYINAPFARRLDQTILFDRSRLDLASPTEAVTGRTLTYGGVLRGQRVVGRLLPRGTDVDLHYAWSENFQGLSGSRSVTGGFYDAPVGETRELGFSVSTLEERLFLRANWFETKQQNLVDPDITQPINTVVFQLPNRLYQQYTLAQLQAAGFAMPPAVVASGSFNLSPPNADGFVTYTTNFQVTDIKSAVSKGFELESTYNITDRWRLAFNVAQVKSIETGKGQNWAETVAWVKTNWFDRPSVANLSTGQGGALDPVSGWEQRAVTDFISAQERNGASNPEIRKWRVNLVTNYTFAPEGRWRGFGVGGAMRFQDRIFLGYFGKPNPADPGGPYIADVTQPVLGPTETDFDFWGSYQRRIFSDRVLLRLQLNVRNAFTHNKLIPIRAQQVDVYSQYAAFDHYRDTGYRLHRIAAPRTVEARATFKF
jgi:outer membrane receptor protein involved in Fe transport